MKYVLGWILFLSVLAGGLYWGQQHGCIGHGGTKQYVAWDDRAKASVWHCNDGTSWTEVRSR
jgi:hypothetical protein